MTKIEAAEVLLKRDVAGFEALLGKVSLEELLSHLPLYIFPKGIDLHDEQGEVDIELTLAGITGFMVTIYLQTDGDCIFGLQNHPDGSGDGLLHSFFYVSEDLA